MHVLLCFAQCAWMHFLFLVRFFPIPSPFQKRTCATYVSYGLWLVFPSAASGAQLCCAVLKGCSLGCMACISGAALFTPKHRKHGVLPSCCFAVCSTPGNRGMLDSYEAGSVPRMLRERPLYHSLFWLIALIVSFLSSATNDGPRGSVGYRTLALGIACISDNGL